MNKDLPVEFALYISDFNWLVQTTIDALAHRDSIYSGNYLYRIISSLDIDHTIDGEDIVQELALIWLKALKNYSNGETEPNCSIRTYLIRMSVWGIRDWLSHEANIPLYAPSQTEEKIEEQSFALDLSFLFYGDSQDSLKDLTDYERYLLYLKYVEDKHIFEIAQHLQKDRSIVSKQLTEIHDKLRSNLNEDTSRYGS